MGETQVDFEAVADTLGFVAVGFSHGVKAGDEVLIFLKFLLWTDITNTYLSFIIHHRL